MRKFGVLILVNLCLAYMVALFPFTASLLHIGPETGDADSHCSPPDTSESESEMSSVWDGDLGEMISGGGRDVHCRRLSLTLPPHQSNGYG